MPSVINSLTNPVIAKAWTEQFQWLANKEFLDNLIPASIILVIGLTLVTLLSRAARRFGRRKFSLQGGMVARKLVAYLGYVLVVVLVLGQFGVELGAILGAAGVAGVAIGFAAQTSLSNIISGIFLIGERPFRIGDHIQVDDIDGTVDTIGLLSLTLRTFDNRSVRIPNETLVKTKVINVSRHPIRRYNLDIGVAYNEDIDHVLAVLTEVAEENVHCLDEPAPLVIFTGFGDSAMNFMLGAWCLREDYVSLRNSLSIELKRRFDKEDIEIPFPHLTIATGKAQAK